MEPSRAAIEPWGTHTRSPQAFQCCSTTITAPHTPLPHHSITPSLHYPITPLTPSPHYSITPLLHRLIP